MNKADLIQSLHGGRINYISELEEFANREAVLREKQEIMISKSLKNYYKYTRNDNKLNIDPLHENMQSFQINKKPTLDSTNKAIACYLAGKNKN